MRHIAEEEGELFVQCRAVVDDAAALTIGYQQAKAAACWIPIEDRLTEALAINHLGQADDAELDERRWGGDDGTADNAA